MKPSRYLIINELEEEEGKGAGEGDASLRHPLMQGREENDKTSVPTKCATHPSLEQLRRHYNIIKIFNRLLEKRVRLLYFSCNFYFLCEFTSSKHRHIQEAFRSHDVFFISSPRNLAPRNTSQRLRAGCLAYLKKAPHLCTSQEAPPSCISKSLHSLHRQGPPKGQSSLVIASSPAF